MKYMIHTPGNREKTCSIIVNNENMHALVYGEKMHVMDVNDEMHDKLTCWEKLHAVSANNDHMGFIHINAHFIQTSARRKDNFMSVKG